MCRIVSCHRVCYWILCWLPFIFHFSPHKKIVFNLKLIQFRKFKWWWYTSNADYTCVSQSRFFFHSKFGWKMNKRDWLFCVVSLCSEWVIKHLLARMYVVCRRTENRTLIQCEISFLIFFDYLFFVWMNVCVVWLCVWEKYVLYMHISIWNVVRLCLVLNRKSTKPGVISFLLFHFFHSTIFFLFIL